MMTNKYHNVKTMANGITFDSKKEANRFVELSWLLKAGEIRNLKLQPEFTLAEAYTTPEGERVKRVVYRADFSYERSTDPDAFGSVYWIPVVEDVKGVRTDTYNLKKRLMREKYGIAIQEI